MSTPLGFTPNQQAAIDELTRPLQLIACAGSGKTEVLAQRIANILSQPAIRPANVIAFTFTEKAAAELKERIHRTVTARMPDIVGLAEMYVGTMHGYCLDLLQTYIPETFKYGVLTDITQQLLIDRETNKSGFNTAVKTVQGVRSSLKRYTDTRVFKGALSVLQEDAVDFGLVPTETTASLATYKGFLADKKYFDYTSMMIDAVSFLERSQTATILDTAEQSLRDHVERDVKYLIVDEYQDVNPIQERLIERLVHFGANLCVVGDDDQTIYQWRGSDVQNILSFDRRYAGVRPIRLEENFRSSKGIVELGRSVAERLDSVERLPKKMIAAGHQAWERGDMLTLQFGDSREEAAWIAERMADLQGLPFVDRPGAEPRGLSWSDCAVLFRSVKDADDLVDELRRRDIPFIIKGLARLFDAVEVQACVGLFRYMVREISASELRALWDAAKLIPDPSKWPAAVRSLDAGADFTASTRWGVYNIQRLFLKVLEALDLREDTIPGDARRAELTSRRVRSGSTKRSLASSRSRPPVSTRKRTMMRATSPPTRSSSRRCIVRKVSSGRRCSCRTCGRTDSRSRRPAAHRRFPTSCPRRQYQMALATRSTAPTRHGSSTSRSLGHRSTCMCRMRPATRSSTRRRPTSTSTARRPRGRRQLARDCQRSHDSRRRPVRGHRTWRSRSQSSST